MAWPVIAAIAGGLISGATSILGAKMQEKSQMRTNEAAARLNYALGENAADNAQKRAMDMYKQQLDDSSPEKQVQRLKDAGLSVGMMYGGAGTTGNVTTIPNGPKGEGAGGQHGGMIDNPLSAVAPSMLNAAQVASQVEVNEATAENIEADTKVKEAEIPVKEATFQSIMADVNNKKIEYEARKVDKEMKEVELEISRRTKEDRVEEVRLSVEEIDRRIDKILSEIDNLDADTDYKNRMKKALEKEINAKIGLMSAQAVEAYSSSRLNDEQRKYISKNFNVAALAGELKAAELQIRLTEIGVQVEQAELNRLVSILNSVLSLGGSLGGAAIVGNAMKSGQGTQPHDYSESGWSTTKKGTTEYYRKREY